MPRAVGLRMGTAGIALMVLVVLRKTSGVALGGKCLNVYLEQGNVWLAFRVLHKPTTGQVTANTSRK